MSLADAVKSGPPSTKHRGPTCGIGLLLTDLPKPESEALRTMLSEGSGWENRQIARLLTDEGHGIGRTTVDRHRRLQCSCAERGLA